MELIDLKDPRKPTCVFLWPSVCWFPGPWNTRWGLRAHLVSLSSPWSRPQRRYFQIRPHLQVQGSILYFPLSSCVLLWTARGNQTAASTAFGKISAKVQVHHLDVLLWNSGHSSAGVSGSLEWDRSPPCPDPQQHLLIVEAHEALRQHKLPPLCRDLTRRHLMSIFPSTISSSYSGLINQNSSSQYCCLTQSHIQVFQYLLQRQPRPNPNRAAVTETHKLGTLKQQKRVLSRSWRLGGWDHGSFCRSRGGRFLAPSSFWWLLASLANSCSIPSASTVKWPPPRVSSSYKDTSHTGSGPTLMALS